MYAAELKSKFVCLPTGTFSVFQLVLSLSPNWYNLIVQGYFMSNVSYHFLIMCLSNLLLSHILFLLFLIFFLLFLPTISSYFFQLFLMFFFNYFFYFFQLFLIFFQLFLIFLLFLPHRIPVTIKVSYPVPYEVKTFVWCARIPPRCPKIRTAMKMGYRDETKLTNQTIKVCCEGFAELEGRCLRE